MNFFTRAANGWNIAKNSLKVFEENKQLLVFPVLSAMSIILILGSFLIAVFGTAQWDWNSIVNENATSNYGAIFLYYLVNYFVVLFFNTALTYCIGGYFKGEKVPVKEGIAYSFSRIGVIFSWAVFAATVGTILRIIQENAGFLGKLISGLTGALFSMATYFVVPVITFENVGPITAFKRSAQMMKQKWGESIGGGFSFAFVQFIAIVFLAIIAITIGTLTNAFVGGMVGVMGLLLLIAIVTTVNSIFVTAVYQNITGDPIEHFNQQFVDSIFIGK